VRPARAPSQFASPDRRHREAVELISAGTERRRQRPKSQEQPARHSSGKPTTQSDKNVVVVNAKTRRVGSVSQTYAGKSQDKKLVDTEGIRYPREASLYNDTGFPGYEPKVQQPRQPKKSRARAR